MADLSDVEQALVNIASAAIYPNGTSQPSSLPGATPVRIYRGWPLPAQLDTDLAAGTVNVSVYPMAGTGIHVYQIEDATYTIVPFTAGLSVVSVVGNVITVSGQPAAGEYLTVICDGANVFSQTGANTAALLAALATQAQAVYPSASSTATALTIPVATSRPIVVRQGGMATLGKVIWRQRHDIMVTVWAPTDVLRINAASAIDIAIKQNNRITLPDTSQSTVFYSRTFVSDEAQKALIYRRDLIYACEYATLQQFPGFVVTTVNVPLTAIDNGGSAQLATAII